MVGPHAASRRNRSCGPPRADRRILRRGGRGTHTVVPPAPSRSQAGIPPCSVLKVAILRPVALRRRHDSVKVAAVREWSVGSRPRVVATRRPDSVSLEALMERMKAARSGLERLVVWQAHATGPLFASVMEESRPALACEDRCCVWSRPPASAGGHGKKLHPTQATSAMARKIGARWKCESVVRVFACNHFSGQLPIFRTRRKGSCRMVESPTGDHPNTIFSGAPLNQWDQLGRKSLGLFAFAVGDRHIGEATGSLSGGEAAGGGTRIDSCRAVRCRGFEVDVHWERGGTSY
jgi:hypothetical protein